MSMKNLYIKINGIADVSHFVQAATQVEGDVIVIKGQYAVDGKSLLGMFSIDPSSGVTVKYPEGEETFENFITQYKA